MFVFIAHEILAAAGHSPLLPYLSLVVSLYSCRDNHLFVTRQVVSSEDEIVIDTQCPKGIKSGIMIEDHTAKPVLVIEADRFQYTVSFIVVEFVTRNVVNVTVERPLESEPSEYVPFQSSQEFNGQADNTIWP